MKTKTEKTPAIRAAELAKMVYGENAFHFSKGWLKLGKFVLDLERKWTKAKRRNSK